MAKYLMGIDRGNTNIKAAVYDFEGREVFIATAPLEPPRKYHLGWAEQDMGLLWENTVRCVRELFCNSGVAPEEIAAIGFSGHGGGLYAIDRQGRPARLAIMSIDSRLYYENLEKEKRGEPILKGSKVDPALLLRWVREHEPETYASIDRVMASKDWIRYCMTGEVAVSRSDFGLGLLMDNATRAFDYSACERYGIPEARAMLTPFCEAWEVCGSVTAQAAAQTGLIAGTPCVIGGHDCALASFGVGGVQPGHLTAILGTFAMNMLVGEKTLFPSLPEDAPGMYAMSVLPDRWLYMNSTMTGRGLDWFINTFCECEVREAEQRGVSVQALLEEKAVFAGVAGASEQAGLIFHPYILPGWGDMKTARAGLYGANMFTTRNDVIRAMFEGIAFAEAESLKPLTRIAPVERLVVTGGGSRNGLWGQIFSDLLELPVVIPDVRAAGCRGAALLAGIGVGAIENHAATAAFPLAARKQYMPGSPDAGRTREKFNRYLELISYNRPYWDSL